MLTPKFHQMCCISLRISGFLPDHLRYQLSLNYKQRALKLKPKKNPEKGNTEMSACNSPVAVVTKDLLVLSPSPGFWPLAPITAIAACGRSHFSLHYLYISLGHVHPSICSPHIPPSSPPRLSALFPPPLHKPLLLPSSAFSPPTVDRAAPPCTDATSCIITPTDAISSFRVKPNLIFSRYAARYSVFQIKAQFSANAHAAGSRHTEVISHLNQQEVVLLSLGRPQEAPTDQSSLTLKQGRYRVHGSAGSE